MSASRNGIEIAINNGGDKPFKQAGDGFGNGKLSLEITHNQRMVIKVGLISGEFKWPRLATCVNVQVHTDGILVGNSCIKKDQSDTELSFDQAIFFHRHGQQFCHGPMSFEKLEKLQKADSSEWKFTAEEKSCAGTIKVSCRPCKHRVADQWDTRAMSKEGCSRKEGQIPRSLRLPADLTHLVHFGHNPRAWSMKEWPVCRTSAVQKEAVFAWEYRGAKSGVNGALNPIDDSAAQTGTTQVFIDENDENASPQQPAPATDRREVFEHAPHTTAPPPTTPPRSRAALSELARRRQAEVEDYVEEHSEMRATATARFMDDIPDYVSPDRTANVARRLSYGEKDMVDVQAQPITMKRSLPPTIHNPFGPPLDQSHRAGRSGAPQQGGNTQPFGSVANVGLNAAAGMFQRPSKPVQPPTRGPTMRTTARRTAPLPADETELPEPAENTDPPHSPELPAAQNQRRPPTRATYPRVTLKPTTRARRQNPARDYDAEDEQAIALHREEIDNRSNATRIIHERVEHAQEAFNRSIGALNNGIAAMNNITREIMQLQINYDAAMTVQRQQIMLIRERGVKRRWPEDDEDDEEEDNDENNDVENAHRQKRARRDDNTEG